MASGRLSPENCALIEDVAMAEPNTTIAAIKIQQLLIASSEFHATGTVTKTGALRPKKDPPAPTAHPYKALVMVMLKGGADTANMIVSHTCDGKNAAGQTVREQYDTGTSADHDCWS